MITWNPGIPLEDIQKSIIKQAIKFYSTPEKAAAALRITIKELDKYLKKDIQETQLLRERAELEKAREEEFKILARGTRTVR